MGVPHSEQYHHKQQPDPTHLGAHLTLVIPYVKGLYGKELDKVAQYGLDERQIRVAVGLEETDVLIEEFRRALKAADGLKTIN